MKLSVTERHMKLWKKGGRLGEINKGK